MDEMNVRGMDTRKYDYERERVVSCVVKITNQKKLDGGVY